MSIVALASRSLVSKRVGWQGTVERITRSDAAPNGRRIETLVTCSHYHRKTRLARECAEQMAKVFR